MAGCCPRDGGSRPAIGADTPHRPLWDREFQPLITLNIIDGEYFHLLKEADSTYLRNIQSEVKPLWPASETKPNIG